VKESGDIQLAKDTVVAIQLRLQQLEADFQSDTAALTAKIDPLTEKIEPLPYWQGADGKITPVR
jgi:hypothetical protein